MAKYVKKWLAAGLPVHGIGLQGHLGGGNPSAAEMQAGMELLAKTGIEELAITELDIVGAPVDEYVKVTEACLAIDACVGITVWGVGDAVSSPRPAWIVANVGCKLTCTAFRTLVLALTALTYGS